MWWNSSGESRASTKKEEPNRLAEMHPSLSLGWPISSTGPPRPKRNPTRRRGAGKGVALAFNGRPLLADKLFYVP
jgi:hypothetical protein